MSSEKIIFSTELIAVKESSRGFQYLERKGKDSVAVFLFRRKSNFKQDYEVLIRQQPLCLDNQKLSEKAKLYPCPITGSISEDETPEAAAVREAKEEGGFLTHVLLLGQYIVGTQTNEICYMYYADVTGLEAEIPSQDGTYFELVSKNEWHPIDYLNQCDYAACQIGYFRLQNVL